MADAFHYTHRVTYAECTLGNHIYYARYLDILEAARGEFFRQLGTTFLQWQEQDTIFPVVECHLRYKAPARYDDVLAIGVSPTTVSGARLNFSYRVIKPGDVVALEAETFHVCTGLNEKPRRVPEELAGKLEKFIP